MGDDLSLPERNCARTDDHSHADDSGKHRVLFEAYGYRWYRVGGLDYLLKRSDIDAKDLKKPKGARH